VVLVVNSTFIFVTDSLGILAMVLHPFVSTADSRVKVYSGEFGGWRPITLPRSEPRKFCGISLLTPFCPLPSAQNMGNVQWPCPLQVQSRRSERVSGWLSGNGASITVPFEVSMRRKRGNSKAPGCLSPSARSQFTYRVCWKRANHPLTGSTRGSVCPPSVSRRNPVLDL
jgi:hypothetical protein